ncbi:MAG: potassium transporter TrkG [Pseudomonadota bacterium]
MVAALRLLGWTLLPFAVFGYVAWAVSLADPLDPATIVWFVFASVILFAAIMLLIITSMDDTSTGRLQAVFTPLLVAACCPLVIGLPFIFTDVLSMPFAAWFEGVSALTTTGGSAAGPPTTLPDALVVWRCVCEWLGGWIFICFAIAIQPVLNIAGMRYAVNILPRTETRSFYHRTVETSVLLAKLYAALTAIATLLLLLSGAEFYLALPLAMTGLATGGYLPTEQGLTSITGFPVKAVFFFVLVLGSMNFTLYYAAFRGRLGQTTRFVEVRGIVRMLILAVLAMVAVSLLSGDIAKGQVSFVDTVFLSISAISTSGISPLGTQTASLSVGILLLSLCVIGGMAGSTTGGVKILRALLIDRFVNSELARLGNPHKVSPVEYAGRVIRVSDMLGIWSLVLVVAATIAIGSLVLSALQMPFLSAISVSVSAVTNAGPLPYIMDPKFAGYAAMSSAMMGTCGVLMLLGKLEFLLVLAFLFSKLFRL